MNRKNFKIVALIFLGFLLLVLPMAGISVFLSGRWWWVHNLIFLLFGAVLLPVAIEVKSYRWAALGCAIMFTATTLFFLVGPYFAQQTLRLSQGGS